jgi:DNA mismatch repair protein MSH5
LQRRKAVEYLPGDEAAIAAFRISTLEMFSLKDVMYAKSLEQPLSNANRYYRFINADTFLALQVFQPEPHPHSHNQGPTKMNSGSKEGLSIYGLFFQLAHTPQGKHLLRQFFLRPSLDINLINERLDTTTVFLHPDNALVIELLVKSLKNIQNMRTVLIHLRKGVSGNASAKGGRIRRGVWGSLVMVLILSSAFGTTFKMLTMPLEVYVPHFKNKGCSFRSCRCRRTGHQSEGKFDPIFGKYRESLPD